MGLALRFSTALAAALVFPGVLGACRFWESAPSEPESDEPSPSSSAPRPAVEIPSARASASHVERAVALSSCPDEMARMGRYCVDRWEAHLVVLNPDGTSRPLAHVERPDKGLRYAARSEKGVFPQAYISRVEAQAACENAGKRLCSRSEWIRACEGQKAFHYPYGEKSESGVCNNGKSHLLMRFFGANPKGWTYEGFNDPKLDQEPDFLARTGAYEGCRSDEGVYDMVGNLHEWVSDNVGPDIEEVLARDLVDRNKQPWAVGNGIFMGGFFSTTLEHGPGCAFTTIAHEPQYHDYSTGFRCCMDVPGLEKRPATRGQKRQH